MNTITRPLTPTTTLVAIIIVGLLYFVSGMAGLMVESAVQGITPIWPPSGIAITAVLLFGYRLLPSIVLGMVLLGLSVEMPWVVVSLAAVGSILEAAIPVMLLRQLGFKGEFNEPSDVLLFASIAVLLGPVFSASSGAAAFALINADMALSHFEIWILWWLGNSLGILVIGSFLLEWRGQLKIDVKAMLQLLVITVAASVICLYSLNMVEGIYSTLLLITILPLTVLSSICCEVKGSSLVTLVILLIFVSSGAWLPSDIFSSPDYSYFYLNAVFIAINAFIGLVVGSSVRKHAKLAALQKQYFDEAERLVIKRTSELKKTQQQLVHAQKSDAIATLVAGIAHEFNNLLTPIIGYTGLLEKCVDKETRGQDYINNIERAGKRAAGLVQQLMAYGKESPGVHETVQLDQLVNEAVDFIKHTMPANITIIKRYEGDDFETVLMPNEIHQVLLNLCVNAIHAMPEGGVLTIRIRNHVQDRFVNKDGRSIEGEFICLTVEDTGSGMSRATMDRVFDPFFTTKEVNQGTGLGLSVVQGIVEQHKGFVSATSEPGEGSEFSVYLPLSRQNTTADEQQPERNLSGVDGGIILIDDEPLVVDYLDESLKEIGYRVYSFTDPKEALAWLRQHRDNIDVVITDFDMPLMNGRDLALSVKSLHPELPVIVITGYGAVVEEEDIGPGKIDQLIQKPIDLTRLGHVINDVLTQNKSQESNFLKVNMV